MVCHLGSARPPADVRVAARRQKQMVGNVATLTDTEHLRRMNGNPFREP
jgi:hypothetical protein